jgi:hypothetical protein
MARYTFSGVFYAVLAFTSFAAVVRGGDNGDDNTIENLSSSMLSSTTGRWLLGVAGVVTIGVGLYFVIEKGIRRSFVDDLSQVSDRPDRGDGVSRVLVVSGVAGWVGRGIVTILVGFFVARAAYRFDPDEARGFDRALRHVATSSTGTLLVWVAAVGLIAYGSFCLLSHRRRNLEDNS